MAGGLGLDQFLNHNEGGGGSRKFFNWKKQGKATIWLSTRANIAYPTWNHSFMSIGAWEDKKTGEEKEAIRYDRYVSPDAEVVHANQFFRDDNTDRMRVPPLLDPFLLLREWLRFECDEPLDTVVFKWTDPKTGEITEWRRGRLARLSDKTGGDWSHSLDSKLEYMFVVVDNENPKDGLQLVRAPKLLGDKMKAEIRQQLESNGPSGNPMNEPYAFRWIFDDKAKSIMDSYRAFRYNAAPLTDEIREAIMATEFPDPTPDCQPRDGDKAKLRAAMEDAAQIDLPWDRIFVPQWVDNAAPQSSKSSGRTQEVQSAAAPATGEPKARRKKAEAPAEPPRIPCDDCGYMMLPTEAKCAGCGAVYELDPDVAAQAPVESTKAPATAPLAATQTAKAPVTAKTADKCWSCSGRVEDNRCTECGLDVTDEIPY